MRSRIIPLFLVAALALPVGAALAQGTNVAFGGLKADTRLPVEVTAENLTVNQTDGTAIPTFMYDCGLAAAQLTIEAHHRGYVVHQMAGFDHEKAATLFDGATPIVIMAIGKQGAADLLEGPAYDREIAPRTRKPLSEVVVKGLPN